MKSGRPAAPLAAWLRSRLVRAAVILLALIAVLAAGASYLVHNYDPARVAYKRLRAASPYVYERIDPAYLDTDPASLITVRSLEDAARLRAALVSVIWGEEGFPTGRLPKSVEEGWTSPDFAALPGLARIDRLTIEMELGVTSIAYHFHPQRPEGRLVLYHHGYAGDLRQMTALIGALLVRGFDVIGINYLGYGENWTGGRVYFPKWGWYGLSVHRLLDLAPRPMLFFVEPVVVALNYGAARGFEGADMIGFSAGGWTTVVAAAVDPRIRRSYPVAGGYPLYLRSGGERNQSPPPQYYGPLIKAADYLDMFVLGSLGPGRRQLQIFNRYDRCCYRNTLARLYEPAVRDAVAAAGVGAFAVLIDETHADHKLSDFGRAAILDDLMAP